MKECTFKPSIRNRESSQSRQNNFAMGTGRRTESS